MSDWDPLDRSVLADLQKLIVRGIRDPRCSCAHRNPTWGSVGGDHRPDRIAASIDHSNAVRGRDTHPRSGREAGRDERDDGGER